MLRTIEAGFRDFLRKLTPSSGESDAAKRHRASIKSCIERNLNMRRFFRSGSFGNGTSISGYSDVDYFASIPSDNLNQNSDTSLSRVRNILDNRFPNTGVRVSCPAVKVPFGNLAKESTEIVPAEYMKKSSEGHHIYKIPNCDGGGWMHSSPEAHTAYVRGVDGNLESKVKPLIRLIKAWKYFRDVPISSFYLELRVTKYSEGESSILYSIDIKRILRYLYNNELADMRDPKGISGLISPCATDAQHEEAMSKLATALTRAEKAREAKDKDNIKDAFYWWNLLFSGKFPSYY